MQFLENELMRMRAEEEQRKFDKEVKQK